MNDIKVEKKLYILAGANGSGKSTISRVLLPTESLVYVNPDDIARELNPSDPTAAKVEAGKATLRRIDEYFAAGTSFAIESTLSGNVYLKVLARAKELGYMTVILYTFIDNPEACIARIAVRVQAGGHYVPDEDVRRRFYRSKRNFWLRYKDHVDTWIIFYNGGPESVLVAYGSGDLHVVSEKHFELFRRDINA